jgi:hypothetical protein
VGHPTVTDQKSPDPRDRGIPLLEKREKWGTRPSPTKNPQIFGTVESHFSKNARSGAPGKPNYCPATFKVTTGLDVIVTPFSFT